MPGVKNLIKSSLFCFAVLCFALPAASFAQAQRSSQSAPADSERTLKALLDEVRQLRIALERMNLSAYRAQILVERLRAQQDRVERLRRDIDSVRNQINEVLLNQPRAEEMVKDLKAKVEAGVQDETPYKEANAWLEQLSQREQQLRQREIQLNTELEIERGSLIDLNSRLDILEREMAGMTPDDKPKQEEKRPSKKP